MSADRAAILSRPPRARSRIANGNALLPGDNRSIWVRIVKDCLATLISHCGGEDHISDTRRLAARRVAALEAELIFLEDSFATARSAGADPPADKLELYGRLADRQRRLADALGWPRTPRDVTPTLKDYIEGRAE